MKLKKKDDIVGSGYRYRCREKEQRYCALSPKSDYTLEGKWLATREPPKLNYKFLTISSVQTRRTQTLTTPSTPSTSLRSRPSHQHRRAGFLQNSRSFWAIPTALLFARSPLISVRSLASARLQMTALLGSGARCPHWSSRSNPLPTSLASTA